MAADRSLDEVYDAYVKEVASGTGNLAESTTIAMQYRVAKAQEKWARVSAWIAGLGVTVAIAAVIVAAVR